MDKTNPINDYNVSDTEKVKLDPEQEVINYIPVPSLKSIALINVITKIWTHPEVKDAIARYLDVCHIKRGYIFDKTDQNNSFSQLEEKFLNKIYLTPLPNVLKVELSYIIRPVLWQIFEWIDIDEKDNDRFQNSMDYIYWTMEGSIDKPKSLQFQLSNKQLEIYYIMELYIVACEYCQEEIINNLWRQIPEVYKQHFYTKNAYDRSDHLVAYWTNTFVDELPRILNSIEPNIYNDIYGSDHSVNINMFELSVSKGNVLATKYFWYKLTDEEISNNVVKWTKNTIEKSKNVMQYHGYQMTNNYTSILCFLLSQMRYKEQQKEVFQKYSDVILEWLFSDWPWQPFLLPTIRMMWDYLEEKVYIQLLSQVVKQIKENSITGNLLKELWCESPIIFKKCFIQHMFSDKSGKVVLVELIKIKDLQAIKLILNDANVKERKQIIFATAEKYELYELIYSGEMLILDTLVEETLSECEKNNFRECVTLKHGDKLCHEWLRTGNWKAVENFLNWGFISQTQIDNFKSKTVNKIDIVYSLMGLNNYELVDKFIRWCFSSEEEINHFKNDIVSSYPENGIRHLLGCEGWDSFQMFLDWCFDSDNKINQFKMSISEYDKMEDLITEIIVESNNIEFAEELFHWSFNSVEDINKFKLHISQYAKMELNIYDLIILHYNFKFAEELLKWSFNSNEESIRKFKKEFILSEKGMDMFSDFITNDTVYDTEYSNWELVKMLTEWYYPLKKEVITEFKEKLKNSTRIMIDPEECNLNLVGNEQALFRLLDTFSLDEDISDGESDYSYDDNISSIYHDIIHNVCSNHNDDDANGSDSSIYSLNDHAHYLLSSLMDSESDCDSDYTDNDNDTEYDEDVVIALIEMLNQVSTDLLRDNIL